MSEKLRNRLQPPSDLDLVLFENIRDGDPVSVSCEGVTNTIRIWRYNPFGCEIRTAEALSVGASLRLKLKFSAQEFSVDAFVIYAAPGINGQFVYGLRFAGTGANEIEHENDASKRLRQRWICPKHMLPTGTAANPVKYNDYILFRVLDISSTGFRVATSLRNKMLGCGLILEASLSIPAIGAVSARVKICRITTEYIEGVQQFVLGLDFVKPDEILIGVLAEYLLTFGEGTTVQSLKREGFSTKFKTNTAFDFAYVKSKEEYEKVVDLRWKSYIKSEKISSGVTREFMSDEFDARSRILIVKHQGVIVGSVRAMFHESSDRTSHERYVRLPESLPPKSEYLEASRLCIDPDYRGADIAYELVSHLVLLTIKSGRRYFFGSAAGSLKEFWTSTGAKFLGVHYTHGELGALEHELLLNDVHASVLGGNVSRKNWKRIYSGVYQYLLDAGLIFPNVLEQLRVAVCRHF